MTKKILLLLLFFIFFSCANKKDIHYYQDINTDSQDQINYLPNMVQINDILYIKISALIPEAAEPFNMVTTNNPGANLNAQTINLQGYLVAQDGSIIFPVLGSVAVAGKTLIEVQDLLKKMLTDGGYIKDAIVSVRITNNKVTVLGEVKSPGTYNFDEQNLSLNQAIGLAGDLTINGIRKDILLIREVNGTRTYVNLDLTTSSWFNGPYYYVKQNDVIIVNPNGPKVMASGYLKDIGTALGTLSFIITLILLFQK
jgi:polysaccharide export outer membrane protein